MLYQCDPSVSVGITTFRNHSLCSLAMYPAVNIIKYNLSECGIVLLLAQSLQQSFLGKHKESLLLLANPNTTELFDLTCLR